MLTERKPRRKGTYSSLLLGLEVGSYLYIESSHADYANLMRRLVPPKSRRTGALRDREFTSALYVTFAAAEVDDVRYLVRVERIA